MHVCLPVKLWRISFYCLILFFMAGLLTLQIVCEYARVHAYIIEHFREVVSLSFSQKSILACSTTKWKILWQKSKRVLLDQIPLNFYKRGYYKYKTRHHTGYINWEEIFNHSRRQNQNMNFRRRKETKNENGKSF